MFVPSLTKLKKMISFILLLIFGVWVIINRFSEGGKVEGHPLGTPRGTVRALSTIMIVAFPVQIVIGLIFFGITLKILLRFVENYLGGLDVLLIQTMTGLKG